MTSLFRDMAAPADLGWLGGSITALFLVLFVAWTAWVLWPTNRGMFEEASRMPLDDGGDS